MSKQKILKLIYKKKEKEMHFFPKSFGQLRDFFLSIFNKKSSQKYVFKGYVAPEIEKKLIFREEDFKESFEKLKELKNMAIFINEIAEDEEAEMENDIKNIEYMVSNIKFEKDRVKKFEEEKKKLELLTKQINQLNDEITILKNDTRSDELTKCYKEFQKNNLELMKKLEEYENNDN
mgnify:FL=1